MLHDDKVYVSFFIGSDTNVLLDARLEGNQKLIDNHKDFLSENPRRAPSLLPYGYAAGDLDRLLRHALNVHADDVMVCLDAKTGQTLWRTAVPGGLNIAKGTYGPHLTPGVDPTTGRVYAVGSSNRLLAFDGQTGNLLWVSDELTKRSGMTKKMESWVPTQNVGYCNHQDYWHVVAVDGVVVCGGIAFDGATGKVLWAPDKGRAGGWQLWPWQHNGKWYVIAGPNACVDIHTGEELWQLSKEEMAAAPNSETRLALAGDLMVAGNTCYRILPEKGGRNLVWRNEKIMDRMTCGAVINRGSYYVLSSGLETPDDKGSCSLLKVDLKDGKIDREWKLPSNKYATHGNMLIAVNDHMFWLGKSTKGSWWINLETTPGGPLSDSDPVFAISKKQPAYPGVDFSFKFNMVHTPAAANGRIYLRSEWSVACLDFNPEKE